MRYDHQRGARFATFAHSWILHRANQAAVTRGGADLLTASQLRALRRNPGRTRSRTIELSAELVASLPAPDAAEHELPESEPEGAPEDTADISETADLEAAAPVETTPDSEAKVSLAEVDAKPEEKGAPPSDLLLLPGAAPGLVWLLQEMGVRNLSDLAKLEPDVLAAGLGIVGRILDVSIWTRFARNHIAQASAEPQ